MNTASLNSPASAAGSAAGTAAGPAAGTARNGEPAAHGPARAATTGTTSTAATTATAGTAPAAHAPPAPRTAPGGPPRTGKASPASPRRADAPCIDPRVGWTAAPEDPTPPLHERRDGILPAVAAALSVRGRTLTSTGNKGDQDPAPHPLVQDFLDTLTTEHRARHTGRCPETVLISRYLNETDDARPAKRTNRRTGGGKKALTLSEAKRALKNAKLTARHIREQGDPLHGRYAPPCRSCGALLAHFGVRPVDSDADTKGAR